MTAYLRDVLVDVLVHHQPTATSGCHCGWTRLGASHPEHVTDVYEATVAGVYEAPVMTPRPDQGDPDDAR